MKKQYAALRMIGSIYKVLGIVVAVVTVILAVGTCIVSISGGAALSQVSERAGLLSFFGDISWGVIFSVVALLYGGLTAVSLYGLGELIYLLIALEENTRTTAEMVAVRRKSVVNENVPKV